MSSFPSQLPQAVWSNANVSEPEGLPKTKAKTKKSSWPKDRKTGIVAEASALVVFFRFIMEQDLDRTISGLIARCSHFYMQNFDVDRIIVERSAAFGRIKSALEKALNGTCMLQESIYEGWIADKSSPGYLVRESRQTAVKVPYHLVPVFPSIDLIDRIWRLSRQIKTSPSSVVCLSGSLNLYEALGSFNDLDFCEYLKHEAEDFPDCVAKKVQRDITPFCVGAKIGLSKVGYPFSVPDIQTLVAKMDCASEELSHGKLDYVATDEDGLPYEISNVLIVCNSAGESAAKNRTFVAQETILDEAVWSPTELSNPFEVGRYIVWLLAQVEDYRNVGNYQKALKRALSLCRVCGFSERTREIAKLCSIYPNVLRSEIEALDNLRDTIRLKAIPDCNRMLVRLEIERQLKDAQLQKTCLMNPVESESFEDAAEAMIKRLRDDLKKDAFGDG